MTGYDCSDLAAHFPDLWLTALAEAADLGGILVDPQSTKLVRSLPRRASACTQQRAGDANLKKPEAPGGLPA